MHTTLKAINTEASQYHAEIKHIKLSGNRHLMQWQIGCGDGSYAAFTNGEVYASLAEAVHNESFLWEIAKMGIKMFKTELFKYIAGDMILVAGKDIQVTMDRVQVEQLPDTNGKKQEKFILYFEGQKKGMVLNKTNVKKVIEIVGSDDTDDWKGVPILLTTEKINAFGKEHNALRIKEVKGWRKIAQAKKNAQSISDDIGSEQPQSVDIEGINGSLFPEIDTTQKANNYAE